MARNRIFNYWRSAVPTIVVLSESKEGKEVVKTLDNGETIHFFIASPVPSPSPTKFNDQACPTVWPKSYKSNKEVIKDSKKLIFRSIAQYEEMAQIKLEGISDGSDSPSARALQTPSQNMSNTKRGSSTSNDKNSTPISICHDSKTCVMM